MCSESFPKEFEKTSEVLPFSKYGLASIDEYKSAEGDVKRLEWLKKAGLTSDEIELYQDNEAGLLGQRKIESSVMKEKLELIYKKINEMTMNISAHKTEQPSTSHEYPEDIIERFKMQTVTCPVGLINPRPFTGHFKAEKILRINKRRKMLRHLEKKKRRILAQEKQLKMGLMPTTSKLDRPGTLWDMKEMSSRLQPQQPKPQPQREVVGGPVLPKMFCRKDNVIQPVESEDEEDESEEEDLEDGDGDENEEEDEVGAVDVDEEPQQEEQTLLEGTQMSVDDIRKIDRFRDYNPGVPSKVLFLKNLAPSVSQQQLSLLFNQFLLANGGSIDVRLLTGRLRGQAFVSFRNENIAIQALEETNGTIMSGRPIIAQFGRNTNRIRFDDFR